MINLAGRVCGIGDEAAPGSRDQIRIHQQAGLTGVELRTVEGRGIHDLTTEEVGSLADSLAEARMVVPVVDTPLGSWAVSVGTDLDAEIDVLRRAARHASMLGCRRLRVMSYPNDGRAEPEWRAESLRRMRVLASIAEDLDVLLLHENCHGWGSQSHDHTLAMLSYVDSKRLRLVFDMGNGIAYGYEPVSFLREVLAWVDHVHVKDARKDPGDGAVFVMPGQGEADVAGCVRLLEQSGYRGWYSVEPHIALIPHLGVSADPARCQAVHRRYVQEFLDLVRGLDG
ncbi:hypothetical protein GCM10012275_59000 [Longimycelium tulufanense]|uniref:Xylose isomerase-like TIM barrel domain-containing protein n=1 Tax=Longimycelium tulufanense TaxID=907463 RepID=A0A8J3CE16_9PSEU|nr:sugar phosphate isomerase/epimerase family protein [Longimycelium tulufanense]GGM80549.1 hypothetical protein GCM10012275_59000 [Longimycelium tulufanense]